MGGLGHGDGIRDMTTGDHISNQPRWGGSDTGMDFSLGQDLLMVLMFAALQQETFCDIMVPEECNEIDSAEHCGAAEYDEGFQCHPWSSAYSPDPAVSQPSSTVNQC